MVSGLQLGPNFGMRLTAEKNFYLRLTVERMQAFVVFTEKHLQSYVCSSTSFTATIKCTNHRLNFKLKSLKHKSLEYKSTKQIIINQGLFQPL